MHLCSLSHKVGGHLCAVPTPAPLPSPPFEILHWAIQKGLENQARCRAGANCPALGRLSLTPHHAVVREVPQSHCYKAGTKVQAG